MIKKSTLGNWAALSAAACFFVLSANAQTTAPSAGLQYLQTIPIPNWTNTGTTQANYDLFAFNPETRVLYIADRVNMAVSTIDTKTNSFIGFVQVPGGGSLNGVLVVPEFQLLAVTNGKLSVFVYDLRVPNAPPDEYQVPGIPSGTDALDYDPLNHRIYVANTNAPYFLTGIDVLQKKIVSQFPIPNSPELFRFNPTDGLYYMSITDGDNMNAKAGMMVYDPTANAMVAQYTVANCVPHGIDIDPVSNTAVLGCGTNQGQVLIGLKDGKVLSTYPDITGTDLLVFNPNTRRFYIGASGDQSTNTGCPQDSTKAYPVIGVIDTKGPASAPGHEVGVTCAGRNSKVGLDPIQNVVYVGTRQYPVNVNDATTGSPGVLAFYDPSGPAQPLLTQAQATLSALNGGSASGSVRFSVQGRFLRADASLQSVTGMTALINIPTTVGNEPISCSIDSKGAALCDGQLLGDPLIGATVLAASDGKTIAGGTVTVPSASTGK